MINTKKPTIIDLFSGAGGLSLGAYRAGFNVSLAVELDERALSAHKYNFPTSKHWNADISNISGSQLLQQSGIATNQLDGLIGGPPCQGFSMIGKRNILDQRNDLFIKFLKLVGQCQPKFFMVENVPGILDKKYDNIRMSGLEFVDKDYSVIGPMRLKASDFGAPTSRERVFFIGYKSEFVENIEIKDFEYNKVNKLTTVEDALFGLPRIRSDWITEEQSWRRVKRMPDTPYGIRISNQVPEGVGNPETIKLYNEKQIVSGNFGTRHSEDIKLRYSKLRQGEHDKISKSVRLELTGLCPTLRAGTDSDHGSFQAVRPIHPTMPRVITPREAARLQGFPDWFKFDHTKWHSFRLIGNSVSPLLAEVILKEIMCHFRT